MANDQKLIEQARHAINTGDLEKARNLILKIKKHGTNPDALNILAVCNAMMGEHRHAEQLFNKICSLIKPTDTLLVNIGLSRLHQQKLPEAIQSFIDAIELNPDNLDALSNLAICYDHLHDDSLSIFYADKAYRLKDDIPTIINIIAKHAQYLGDTDKAITLYRRSLSIQPQQQTYVQLSNASFIAKKYEAAEETLKQGISLFSNSPYLLNSLGNFYATRNRHDEAFEIFNEVLDRFSDNLVAVIGKTRSLIARQKFEQAEKILKQSHEAFSDNPEINSELCNYLILTKKYEQAYDISKEFISSHSSSKAPVNILNSHSTACIHSSRLEEAKNTLSSIIERNDVSKETLETINYSLGDTLDKMKQYDDAFHHYKVANEVIPKPSDIKYYESIFADLSANIDRPFLDKIGTSDNTHQAPIFIVGMPRSGTSLVEQILSSHPDVHGGGELTDLWKIGNDISQAMNLLQYVNNMSKMTASDLQSYSDTYLNKISSISEGKTHVTDKLPHNFFHLGLIDCLFPNAKIIHCQRHPFDTCLSIYFRKFNDNHVYAENLDDLARFYKKYMALMDHWQKDSSLSILNVRYEDMITDQEGESHKLINHLGLDWDDEVLKYFNSDRIIMTPSYHQASKPIYTSSMYRWKNYKNHIQPLVKVLGDPERYTI